MTPLKILASFGAVRGGFLPIESGSGGFQMCFGAPFLQLSAESCAYCQPNAVNFVLRFLAQR